MQIIVIHGFICLKRVARVTPVHHIEPVICVARNLYKKKKKDYTLSILPMELC